MSRQDLESDLWETPIDFLHYVREVFNINYLVDLTCTENNNKGDYIPIDVFNLEDVCELQRQTINKKGVYFFMNPPYSRGNIGKFIRRAWELSEFAPTLVLVPTRVLSASYMDFLDITSKYEMKELHIRVWDHGVTVYPLSKRVRFTHPTKQESSPSFETILIKFDRINNK